MAREEKGTQVSSYDEGPSIGKTSADERDTSLSARRTRLRELAKSNLPASANVAKVRENPEPVMHSVSEIQESNSAIVEVPTPITAIPPIATPAIQAPPSPQVQAAAVQVQALEVLNHIDQAMESCAVNLATLQKAAFDQTETLKILAKTLQNQTFSEISLNLSSLTESLSAALEPMKAVGELIPSLDELVNVINTRESHEPANKLSTDDLLISLSEQLASGHIDPWTFKCACLAVVNEQPADILRRLVDLLSAQSLSGEVFQVAHEAIQEAEPEGLRHSMVKSHNPPIRLESSEMQTINTSVAAVLTNEALTTDGQTSVSSTPDTFDFLEQSQPGQVIPTKSELSLDQMEEVNKRYDELNEAFLRHERVLQERETELLQRQQELQQKDSENKILKAQMEELLERTEELAKELQRQAVQPKPEIIKQEVEVPSKPFQPEMKPSPSFFDMDSSHQSSSLFDTAKPPVSLFEESAREAEDQTLSLERKTTSDINQAQAVKDNGAKALTPAAKNVDKPQAASANSPFVSGAGSYGSGVRAQVFEVIVRQALAGAEWREICSGPMQVNNISPEEVDSEVKRRQALLKK